MIILIENHPFAYEMENLCRVFFPNEKFTIVREAPEQGEEDLVRTGRRAEADGVRLSAGVRLSGRPFRTAEAFLPDDTEELEAECERTLAVLLFGLLKELTGVTPSWGILTGVRPIKLLRRLTQEAGEAEAADYFREKLLVSQEKTALALTTMRCEQEILSLSRRDSYSLYISIPFCPTRCAYCSFVSQSVEKAARLMPDYVEKLCWELEAAASLARAYGLRLETVYIGGGTPTTLTAGQLERLIGAVRAHFDPDSAREFTVEAGRADTITPDKLAVMKAGGVTRISINPQTLNDGVLETIGRRHTSAQTLEAFAMARDAGFDNINMDLIAGLPGEPFESFERTLSKILALSPESVTIHTLAMKRSSRLTQEGQALYRKDCEEAEKMLAYARERLLARDYLPYYLYRQSRMVGNLENVGWAKRGYEGLYNVYVMDETHTVLGCGAGAVSKIKEPGGEQLDRVFNFKFPYEYLSRFEEMLQRKEEAAGYLGRYFSGQPAETEAGCPSAT